MNSDAHEIGRHLRKPFDHVHPWFKTDALTSCVYNGGSLRAWRNWQTRWI